MHEYEHALTIQALPQDVFNFISDVRNLPKYLPTVHDAVPLPGGRVRVAGVAAGNPYDSDGFLHIDKSRRRMEWGSDGENQYRGWMEVREMAGGHAAEIIVHLSFEPRPEQAQQFIEQTGDADRTIQKGLEAALESVQNILEGRGRKVATQADRK